MHRLAPEWVFPSRVESATKNSLHAFRLKIFLTGNYTLSVQPSWRRMENEPLFLPRRTKQNSLMLLITITTGNQMLENFFKTETRERDELERREARGKRSEK